MRLTQYTDCLLRVAIYLAEQQEEVAVKELVEKLFIPQIISEKVLKDLLSEEIIKKSLNGKYSLKRSAGDIRLYDLLIISEKTLSVVPASEYSKDSYRDSPWYATDYMTRYFYRELQKKIEISTKSLTLRDLLQVFSRK
ncbi:TPA: Rrf2 family transcriptional regulator [Streptococcus equi subsp. zooepidemicus]|uniref:Rrf2 family transcriptional regulator n=1 Tax=Streptococcus equi TaxID=1336 RepID=UPI0005BD7D08|nr:Rrf2 family transcriptional regulator [Streptococcus equi]KIS04413.1 Rrf2 family protein [Streptococcus equi subsp. zooepidemicus Sz12is]MCD3460505.1 Rrf2 family transcriptional regulator [Streptococcus equi subsp. zooepidemicus]HEK9980830.1 Rrf2 family transcriptional regulator [Streptococcus equi subsp. zooepidemicus]HEL0006583.1 Rrf2 family transcriptional regulator [Streptococcus equi subsp. zooepidemicus]HEL0120015.1 Rrf2 family transcriptional regulator [Streptococcus equi subsp. zooe